MGGRKILFGVVALAIFTIAENHLNIAFANIYPPTPIRHFYGDANGDTGVTGADIIQHNNYILSKVYAYDTLQPNNSAQSWNTCDVDSNRGCTGADTVILNSYLLSKNVSIVDDPWSVNNLNLPLTDNPAATWIPFNIELHSTYSFFPSGRPGVSVVVEIDPVLSTITGQLSGRECNPIAGSRDQSAAAFAQCVLAVTQTNWPVSAGTGPTEFGTYGLQIMGDGNGDLNLKVYTMAIPGLDVPATSMRMTVSFMPADTVDIACGDMNETDSISCPVVSSSGDNACFIGPGDTCGGSIDPVCIEPYMAPPIGEADNPGTCVAEVVKGLAMDTEVVSILKTNQNPSITVDCPENVGEMQATSCALTATDSDLPSQTLTCALSDATRCDGATINGCESVDIPAQGEASGPGWCFIVVDVNDDVDPYLSGYDQAFDLITIDEENQFPVWTSVPKDIWIKAGNTYNNINIDAADADLPNTNAGDPGKLDCSTSAQTCSFPVTVSGSGNGTVDCNIGFTAGASSETCSVTVNVSDGHGATISDDFTIVVLTGTTIWYVDSDAPGAQIGTSWFDAFHDVQDAVDVASSGDMVWVAEGTYTVAPAQNYALSFDGVDDYAQIADSTVFQLGTTASLEAWVKLDSCHEGAILEKWVWGAEHKTLSVHSDCRVDVYFYNVMSGKRLISPQPIPLSRWTHVAGTYDGSQARLYVDGQLVASAAASGNIADSTGVVWINQNQYSQYFKGKADDIRWWNVTRTQQQIQDNMYRELTGTETGLVGYWNFDESSVQVIIDKTGRGNNGVLGASSATEVTDPVRVTDAPFSPIPSTESVLVMKDDVAIYGGFAGTESDLSQRTDPAAYPTVLDGQNASYHVVVGASNARLDGFTVTGGNAPNDPGTDDNGPGNGGGIYLNTLTNTIISNCLISGNHSGWAGGGIFIKGYDTSVQLADCVIQDNTAQHAAGLHNRNSSPTVVGCLFKNNVASVDGGGIYYNASSGQLVNCIIIGNTASHQGGGIFLYASAPSINSCTIGGNNAVASGGGGIYNNLNSSPVITNCILWGNTAPTGSEIYNYASTPVVSYSDIQGGYTGTGNINADPLFMGNPDLHLQYGSPCINSGTASGAPSNDLDGNPRPSPLGGAFDMGAYEYHRLTISLTCPGWVLEPGGINCTITVDGSYVPSETVTCSLGAADTCGGTLTGCTNYNLASSAGKSPNCVVDVMADENTGEPNSTAEDSKTVSVGPDSVALTCPSSANEDATSSCTIIGIGPSACSIGATTTCTGVTITGCTQIDIAPQGELAGPGSCKIEVAKGSSNDSKTITINEVNTNPIITSACATSASEGVAYTCALTATDADIPVQTLTWTTTAANTCPGTISGSTYNNWTPSEAQGGGTCMIGVQVADNFSTPGTATQSTTVTVVETNTNPVITSTCTTSASEGAAYSCSLTATDADLPAQTLTWSKLGTDTCGGTVSPTTNPGTYSWTPSETQGGATCVVAIRISDNWSTPGTASQSTTVTVAETNVNPVITSTCSTSALESVTYSCALTATDADVPAQTLTWSKLGTDTCGGTVTGSTYSWTPSETQGGATCVVAVRVSDNWSTPGTATQSTTVTIAEFNVAPTWIAAPTTIYIHANTDYNNVNGTGGDTDTPNTATTDPGYINCAKTAQTCSFDVTVTSVGHNGTTGCNLSFTSGVSDEICTVTLQVSDGWTDGWTPAGQTAETPVTINVSNNAIILTGVSVSDASGGIDPAIARIKNNYPADWGQFTINFDGSPGATCGATVNCGSAVTVTGVVSGYNCVVSASAGYWPSASSCAISAITTSDACLNCAAYTTMFYTSLRTSECATRGGTCGGFIDNGTYGSGDGLSVHLIDMKSVTGAYVIPTTNYVYVLTEHPGASPSPVRIEAFDANRDGIVTITSAEGLRSEAAKITVGYKGFSGVCEVNSVENPICYRFATMSDIDSRRVHLPMELTTVGDWALPEAQIWGYIPISNFTTYVGPTPTDWRLPNPMRAGIAIMGLIDQGMSSVNLDDLLRQTGETSTWSICVNSLGTNIGGIKLPGNLMLPDFIRQDWNAPCAGKIKMSPANTTFRIYTNRGGMARKVIVMGASVTTSLLDLHKSLDITLLPITMTALGTDTINIPTLTTDINMGDVSGAWGTTTEPYPTPKAVSFEFDLRSTTAAYPVTLHEANPPYDAERQRLGLAANPDYGDPNRNGATNHSGQFYCLGENQLILGARAGSSGLIPFQIVTAPKIDDSTFTVFQRHNVYNRTFTDQEPWGTSSTNTRVVSATMRGLPSTRVDSDIEWSTATMGLVGVLLRGFVETASPSNALGGKIKIPGSSTNSNMVGVLESVRGQTFGASTWLPLPTMTSPANDGYRVPPQAELTSRAWPINRNGQLIRGTATIASHAIQTSLGARYFMLSNPAVSSNAARYADIYSLNIIDTRHIANPFYEAPRGYPKNTLWTIYGNVNGQTSLTVTLPFIAPRRVTMSGVYGTVPDPWEAGNFTNLSMDWELTETIFDTGARGINRQFNYQNMSFMWLYDNSYLSSTESHQFIWR